MGFFRMVENVAEAPALLLAGHGTREWRGTAEFLELAELVARCEPRWHVAAGFLELAEPSLWEAADELVRRGVREIVLAPLFLLAAGHVKRDLPAIAATLAARYPQVQFRLTGHLGRQEKIVALSAQRFEEALAVEPAERCDTLLVLASRGAYDRAALAEMREFANARLARTPVGALRVGYLSLAEPAIEEALSEARSSGFRRVVVQPHLLFEGDLLGRLRGEVAAVAAQAPWQQWIVANHLGPALPVAEAIWELVHASPGVAPSLTGGNVV